MEAVPGSGQPGHPVTPARGPLTMERLTPREQQVLGLLTQGLSDREIAARLFISPHTATTHVKRIRAKLGGGRRAAAVTRALSLALGQHEATGP